MLDRMPRAGYGYGVLRISFRLASHIASLLQIRSTDVQGQLQDNCAFDQVKQGLLLPEDYAIMGVFLEPYRYTWCIVVEAPGIPIPEEGALLPVIMPTYQIDARTGVRSLLKIDIAEDYNHVLRVD